MTADEKNKLEGNAATSKDAKKTGSSDDAIGNSEENNSEKSTEKKPTKKHFTKEDVLVFVFNIKTKLKEKSHFLYHFVRNNFRPTVLTSITTVIGIILLTAVGIWQLQCFADTAELITKIERNYNKDREELPPASMLGEAEQFDYRKVTATGEMMFLNSMNLMSRKYDGKKGYHVLTPLRMDNGEVVLVDRGWVENGQKPNNSYWQTTDITINGIVRIPEDKGRFTADNNVKKNEWYWIDLEAMAKSAGVLKLYPLIIEQERILGDKVIFPIGGQTILNISNNHFNYAILSFVMAGVLVIVWIIYSLQQGILINKAIEEAKSEVVAGNEDSDEDDIHPKKASRPVEDDNDTPLPAKKASPEIKPATKPVTQPAKPK